MIGDVVGSPGRSIMKKALPHVFREHDIDYVLLDTSVPYDVALVEYLNKRRMMG